VEDEVVRLRSVAAAARGEPVDGVLDVGRVRGEVLDLLVLRRVDVVLELDDRVLRVPPRALTPLTIASASALALSIDGCIEPVVSIAISMSAFGGFAGTPTVLASVAVPSVASPARSVNVLVAGERLAAVTAARVRATSATSATSAGSRMERRFMPGPFRECPVAGGGCKPRLQRWQRSSNRETARCPIRRGQAP
jgi:hypothetical protein